ncbi:MAG: type I-E CRISPR-associated protein Cse1/CasA [Abitibacteriaceae bacterium]|nr:type I-E CRISPR-associated protein Cse1/CasA [Abditibacteriaceae bacterium]
MPELLDEVATPAMPTQQEPRFDVAYEPWLPLVRENGDVEEAGLIETLCQAHEIQAIRDPMPPVECGLVRLLVAFALDIFEPDGAADWEEVWEMGRFDEARVRAYFDKYADRFNLFDEVHPFLQDAAAGGDDKPLAGLLPSQPAGTNAAHFQHGVEADFAVAPALAARLLATIAPFMTAGGAGLSPSINGAPPWYVLLQGANLFETIWLNCLVLADLRPKVQADVPAWRDDRPLLKTDRTEAGLLEALTWRPRRIRLVPHLAPQGNGRCALSGQETPVLVGRMKFAAAWSTRFEWRDPNVPRRVSTEGAIVLRPREGREVWRDVGALALLRHSERGGSERPSIVSQFASLIEQQYLPEDTPLRLALYGMRTDMKMKVFEWHREMLRLPAPLLWQQQFQSQATDAIKLADDVAYALGRAIKHTYPRDGAGNDKAFEPLIARAQSQFWRRLRPYYTDTPDSLLYRLAPLHPERDGAQIQAAIQEWHKAMRQVAQRALDQAIGELDTDGAAMKRQMEARSQFAGRLWALLNPEAAATAKEKKKKESKHE